VIGLTDLDRDVAYDDGQGALMYLAPVGFTASAYVSTADFSVDNADTKSLFPEFDIDQLTEADVQSGAYDYAQFKLMLVNYDDLSQGHITLMTGTLGEMKTIDGLSFFGELRSLFQQYRQSIVERDSLTCRATFGSQSADSSNAAGAPKIERFPCGIVVDGLWSNATVTQVGAESNLVFASTGLVQFDNAFTPGVVEWLTGANAGRQYEVESYTFSSPAGGTVTLAFPTAFPITDGDTLRIRPDCTKRWNGPNSCFTYGNRLNFRGEPFIPVGDSGSSSTPGSSSNGGLVGGEQGVTSPGTPSTDVPADVPLINPDFTTTGGWTAIRNDGVPGFSIEPTEPGFENIGVLRWQSGPSVGSGFDFGDIFANDAVGVAYGVAVRAEMRVRCTALSGMAPDGIAVAYLGLQGYEDEACTIPIGPPARSGDVQFSDATGEWRIMFMILPEVPTDRFYRLVVVAYTGSNATLEFDKARWNLDLAAWNSRGS